MFDRTGNVEARGSVVFRPEVGDAALVLRAVGAGASCADLDGDGIVGLTSLTIEFLEVHSGLRRNGSIITASFDRSMGEIEEDGRYLATLEFDDTSVDVELRVLFGPASGRAQPASR